MGKFTMLEERIESKELYDEGEFRILLTRFRMGDGKEVVRPIIDHPASVLVVPLLDDGRIVMVRQYRAGLGKITLEFPCGKAHPGEELTQAAHRETAEEAKCALLSLSPMGRIAPAPGLSSEIIYLYQGRARPLSREEIPESDPDEYFETEAKTAEELESLILSGELIDSKTIAAFYHWKWQEQRV